MHTAEQLHAGQFAVALDGRPASLSALLPDWTVHDRFGIVVHEPFGALGASLLIQAATTAFYDARPERRTNGSPQYPEIYLFHVGGPHGDHRAFDFWPPRKEVFLAADPAAVLAALNDRAISRLAVPDGPAGNPRVAEYWADRTAFEERLVTAVAYAAPGATVDGADLRVTARDPVLEVNGGRALDPEARLAWYEGLAPEEIEPSFAGPTPVEETYRWAASLAVRADEVPGAERERVAARRRAMLDDGLATEDYRRLSVPDALARLVPG